MAAFVRARGYKKAWRTSRSQRNEERHASKSEVLDWVRLSKQVLQARQYILTHYDSVTGSVYAAVVKKCLDVDPHSELSEEKNNDVCAALLSELISELGKCSA